MSPESQTTTEQPEPQGPAVPSTPNIMAGVITYDELPEEIREADRESRKQAGEFDDDCEFDDD